MTPNAKSRDCYECICVILNEVKDQYEVKNVSVKRYCRRVILHFVQDDKSKSHGLVYMYCS
jgi:hypothetical protein